MACGCEQSGMNGCCSSGLSGLYGLDELFAAGRRAYEDGLNGLMGELASGSRVRVGLEFEFSHAYDPDETEAMGPGPIQNLFYGHFGSSFRDVRVSVQMPTFWSDGYVTVEATSTTPLPDASTFGQMVEAAFRQYLPRYLWEKTHETLIDYAPPTPNAQPAGPPQRCDFSQLGLQDYLDCQLGRGRWANQQTQNQNQPGQPSRCAGMSPGDWIACQLGITPTAGVAAGAIGTLVLVGGILAVVVFLKR
jgi:hypothetical protein